VRELARQGGVSQALADYHVRRLVAEGLVEGLDDGHYLRLFPTTGRRPRDSDRATLALLRQPIPLALTLHLLGRKEATHGELAASLRLAKSTASYHLAKLVQAGVLTQTGHGFRVHDRAHVRHLVATWRPPSALVAGFQSSWSGLYGR